MKGFSNGLTWITAAALIVSMSAAPAFAAKTTPATDKNTAVPAVPRAIPDLIPYHKFDPPKSKEFDLKNLTISGDIRVRPEFRNNGAFGLSSTTLGSATGPNANTKRNDFFVQQWVRLGINYAISPDVDFFFQPQWSKAWGGNPDGLGAGDPNSSGGTIFARQAFMLIRNFGIKNLTLKAGRQLTVWGNHRMFGHFDWNNVGWSQDGVALNYKLMKNVTLQTAWLRVEEGDCAGAPSIGGGCAGGGNATAGDADIIYFRAPMKFMGVVIEPAYIWNSSGTGSGAFSGNRFKNQTRHTVGGRVTTKRNIGKISVDMTGEAYYQFGEIGPVGGTRDIDIEAYAAHFDAGVTLPVPMQPRIGGEFNVASGDPTANSCSAAGQAAGGGACGSEFRGFDQQFPTNHIHFGYMDRMAWKNMVHFTGNIMVRPTKKSHLEVAFHKFYLHTENDNWYGANQLTFITTPAGNTEDDLGTEVDVVYTLFFTPGNHVGWQIGGGAFFPGDYIEGNALSAVTEAQTETWGYTQLWINF